jgi:hypothetical protein
MKVATVGMTNTAVGVGNIEALVWILEQNPQAFCHLIVWEPCFWTLKGPDNI